MLATMRVREFIYEINIRQSSFEKFLSKIKIFVNIIKQVYNT